MHVVDPLGYIEFMSLVRGAAAIVTDSGGVQEETTLLRVPCLTLRPNTERPITITSGSNRLVTSDELAAAVLKACDDGPYAGELPPLWDGQAGPRIARIITSWLARPMSETPQAPSGQAAGASPAEDAEDEIMTAAPWDIPLPFGAADLSADGYGDEGGGSGDLSEDAGVAAERERLSRQLRDTRVQLAMTETRLAALEQSSTMRFGRTIANAAKKPWPRGALLPRDLYKLWRDRGAPKSGAQNAAAALAAAQLADLKGTGGRFLSALTAPGALALSDPGLVLAGPPASTPRPGGHRRAERARLRHPGAGRRGAPAFAARRGHRGRGHRRGPRASSRRPRCCPGRRGRTPPTRRPRTAAAGWPG